MFYKRNIVFFVLILLIVLTLPLLARGNKEEEIVATVNGEGIPQSRVDILMEQQKQQMAAQAGGKMSEEQEKNLEQQVIDQLITEELLYQEAQERGVSISDSELNKEIDSLKSRYPDEESFKQALEQTGFNEESFRFYLERNLVIQKLLEQEVQTSQSITEEEMREFYNNNQDYFKTKEQVEARHILISTQGIENEEKQQEAYQRAQKIKEQLEQGANFAELAKEKSEGPSSSQGGNLGKFSRGQMVPAFEEAAFALDKGEISEVVETKFGFHIIQVTGKFDAGVQSFEEAKPNIRNYLQRIKQQEQYQTLIDKLREDATIERG
jgi:peptidyl-prolyl cis-trans isomerase C